MKNNILTDSEELALPIEIDNKVYFMVCDKNGITTESMQSAIYRTDVQVSYIGEYEICAKKGNKYYTIKIKK